MVLGASLFLSVEHIKPARENNRSTSQDVALQHKSIRATLERIGRHLASTLYKQLHALHDEPDCMSVRFLQPTGSGSDQLRKYIAKLRGDLLSFYGFADALRRGN